MTLRRPVSRRLLLQGALGLAGAQFLLPFFARGASAQSAESADSHHLVWVWQFSEDGEPDEIGRTLQDAGLGIVLKTHDGTEWMSEFDESPYGVTGPAQVAVLAKYYEEAGIPFHAWAVIKGVDPVVEAEMAAAVLSAGARTLYLSVGTAYDSWRGSAEGAAIFSEQLLALQPDGPRIILSIDPRPWLLEKVPLDKLAGLTTQVASQDLWRAFSSSESLDAFEESGFPVPERSLTPEFLMDLSQGLLSKFGLSVQHMVDGSAEAGELRRALDMAASSSNAFITMWRFGNTSPEAFDVLRERPAPLS